MAEPRSARESDFRFKVDGLPDDKLRVARFTGREAVSEPFLFELELVSTDSSIEFDQVVGKPAVLRIEAGKEPRLVHGIVSRFEQAERGRRFTTYFAELTPLVSRLSRRATCRIFQKQTVQGRLDLKSIVRRVLEDGGVPADQLRFALKDDDHPQREFCVQYRETDLDFVSRLAEEEGVFWFFEHEETKHVLVMADHTERTVAIRGPASIAFRPLGGKVAAEEVVFEFRVAQELRSGTGHLRDYSYHTPSSHLERIEFAEADNELEVYDYPGEYAEPELEIPPADRAKQDEDEAARITGVRIEELRATRIRGVGQSTCRRFLPGFRFAMTGHVRDDDNRPPKFNREYVLLRVTHIGVQPQVREEEAVGSKELVYRNSFECIPSDVSYRPPRLTPKPRIHGVQTAVVTGPEKEKLHMDELGRARIRFHWDLTDPKDDKSSCWVRVSHGYAGDGHGIQFHPLVGDEVIVAFVEGDPDRPVITGRVYNETNRPPLKPEGRIQNVIRTPYKHQLLLDDKGASVSLTTGGGEALSMGDGKANSEKGNNLSLSTADGHTLSMEKGKVSAIYLFTEGGHQLVMRDSPDPGIYLIDKSSNLWLVLNTKDGSISITNHGSKPISIATAGGEMTLSAKNITIDATENLTLKGKAKLAASSEAVAELKGKDTTVSGSASLMATGKKTTVQGTSSLDCEGSKVRVHGSSTELSADQKTTIKGSPVDING